MPQNVNQLPTIRKSAILYERTYQESTGGSAIQHEQDDEDTVS